MAASASTPTRSAVLVLFMAAVITVGAVVAVGATTALDDVCAGLGGYYVTPELCVSALCQDPSSSSSCRARAARDATAVAAIAARLTAANATAARDSVEAALSSYLAAAGDDAPGKKKKAASALRQCLRLYGGVVPALRWAARSVAAGRFPGAREVMMAARYVPAGCDGVAEYGGVALPSENEGFDTMATVAHAVLAALSEPPRATDRPPWTLPSVSLACVVIKR